MIESFITIIIIGFTAGFIFSIPVAGPINIIITSNALRGNLRFCLRTAFGASIIEFFYVLIIVFGISSLYSLYQPFIPYLLLAGAVILIFIGIRIIKSDFKIDTENEIEQEKNNGGFRTGIIINLTNPSLFLGWLTSTFIIFSLASSLGLNTGGLNLIINKNVSSFQEITGNEFEKLNKFNSDSLSNSENIENEKNLSPILLGTTYGLAVSIGAFVWLYLYSKLIIKYRKKLNLNLLSNIVRILGVVLCIIAVYLIYKAVEIMNIIRF